MRQFEELKKNKSSFSRYAVHGQGVEEAGRRLIDPHNLLDSVKGPRRPLVITSFDEPQILAENPQIKWTLYSELRCVLREIVFHPIFPLFLSAAGKFSKSSPEQRFDPSDRIVNSKLWLLHPITKISFDDIAVPANENTVSLSRVVEMDWICHLGRPWYVCFGFSFFASNLLLTFTRFGTRYDALVNVLKEEDIQKHLMDVRNRSFFLTNLHFVETRTLAFWYAFQSVLLSSSILAATLESLLVNKWKSICVCVSLQPAALRN